MLSHVISCRILILSLNPRRRLLDSSQATGGFYGDVPGGLDRRFASLSATHLALRFHEPHGLPSLPKSENYIACHVSHHIPISLLISLGVSNQVQQLGNLSLTCKHADMDEGCILAAYQEFLPSLRGSGAHGRLIPSRIDIPETIESDASL